MPTDLGGACVHVHMCVCMWQVLWVEKPAETIVAADAKEIMDKFQSSGKGVVLSAAKQCKEFCELEWSVATTHHGPCAVGSSCAT